MIFKCFIHNIHLKNHVDNSKLKKLKAKFGDIPQPIRTHLTRWHEDPFATGSYSYIGIGSSGADYDILFFSSAFYIVLFLTLNTYSRTYCWQLVFCRRSNMS